MIPTFFSDYARSHFHVQCAEHKAVIDIKGWELMEGKLPRRILRLVLE
ncbi:DUF4160 domain-containing protein [Glaciimonas sp. Gout2]|nr:MULTISPECIES: DUF4160 domain-containing protein [unclassified Glaciimonas]MEB0014352.1 DUF4160 domain-containing protein [Glaciimonas sp. Cout2]MEB0084221.1 DUF4160 domain-containing protein [Glaciimonas sp. Gout2]